MTTDQERQRLANLEALREAGVDPYPYRFDATHHSRQVLDAFDELEAAGAEVRLAGRIVSKRGHGKTTFAHIQDRDGKVQVYLKRDLVGEDAYAQVKLYDLGDVIGVRGTMFRTRMGEVTVEVHEVTLLAKCLQPLPEKWHGLKDVELRYRQRYLDLVVNEDTRRIFRARTAIVREIRRFLDDRDFLEVETPVLQPIYGGAFATPFTTWHKALDMQFYLRISDELYLKRLIVGGMERVYEIARDFRNEGIDRNHNPEFTMLEFYQAYADYEDMMRVTEDLVSGVVRTVTGSSRVEFGEHTLEFAAPWKRVTYYGAIREATGVDLKGMDEAALRETAERLGIDLAGKKGMGQVVDEIFSETVEASLVQPTFVTDFPVEISPLAKRHRDDPRVVERFELFAAGMELGNAFSEQNDPFEQEAAFDRQSDLRDAGDEEAQVKDEDYLRALRIGMPPTGGVGIGVDRLTMILTGAANIREVILFPQLRHETGAEGTDPEPEPAGEAGDA